MFVFCFLKKRMDELVILQGTNIIDLSFFSRLEGWLITTQTYRSCWDWFHFSLVAGRNAYIREKDVSKNENQEELKK